MNAVSRSPILSWFSESLSGLSTIRAFGQQAIFAEINERRVDRNQMCFLPSTTVNRWLAVRLEFIGASIIFISSLLAVGTLMTSGVDAGLVGLVISYALNTTSSLVSRSMGIPAYEEALIVAQNWLVRSASEVEQNIVSVERMLQYIELKPEAPYEVPDAQLEGGWPNEGRVEFRCVFLGRRVRRRAYSLQELLVEIPSRARLGAKEYLVDDGIAFWCFMHERCTDQAVTAPRRENRNLRPYRCRKVVSESPTGPLYLRSDC